ncbi:MAG: DMT family transporter [Alphaproteobacteria bacterium]|nr:MAG: DMT family transporter [Alphaproteobacteria bacterium]
MRLFLITSLALIAFAANSVLTRMALAGGDIGPALFTAIRLGSGLALLAALVRSRPFAPGILRQSFWRNGLALLIYAAAFSWAYLMLDAGTGALLLFAGVQVTVFAGALLGGERPGWGRWLGSALGLSGLAVLFLPGATAPDTLSALLMLVAAAGWGVYTLQGRGSPHPLADTASSFLWAAGLGGVPLAVAAMTAGETASLAGIGLAVASGAVASGCGYAIWYTALRSLSATLSAVAMTSVPLIAMGGGMVFLAETLTWRFVAGAALIAGGVLLAIRASGVKRPA